MATTIVLTDISTAPMAGESTMPQDANTPAASVANVPRDVSARFVTLCRVLCILYR
jgi:hypothetical protein